MITAVSHELTGRPDDFDFVQPGPDTIRFEALDNEMRTDTWLSNEGEIDLEVTTDRWRTPSNSQFRERQCQYRRHPDR